MKTLIFNGSPRKTGSTTYLITELSKLLDGEVKVIDAYSNSIKPCIDCRFCWENDGCAQKDGMQELYQDIEDCNNIVIASPIYFSELTGELLNIGSRLQMYFAAKYFRKKDIITKKKNGAILLCGGGDGSMEKAEDTAVCLLHHLKAEPVGRIYSHNTNLIPADQDAEAMKELKKLALKLNYIAE